MKIELFIRKTMFIFFFAFISFNFHSTLFCMEILEESAGREAFQGVEESTLNEIGSTVENTLGKDLPSLDSLPKEVTEEFKSEVKQFVEENMPKLQDGTIDINAFNKELGENLTNAFNEKLKPAVTEFKGNLTEAQIDGLSKFKDFSAEDINNIKALEGPSIPEVENITIRPEQVPVEPQAIQDIIELKENTLGELESTFDDLTDATTSEEITSMSNDIATQQNELVDSQNKLDTARQTEVNTLNSEASEKTIARKNAESEVINKQEDGNQEEINQAQDDLEAKKQDENESKEKAKKTEVKAAKDAYDGAKTEHEQAKAEVATLEKKLSGLKEGTKEYTATETALNEAKERLSQAEDNLLAAKTKWEQISEINKPWYKKAAEWAGNNILSHFATGFIFLVPSWVQQSLAEGMQNRALRNTLKKNQRFGDIYMTLPRCYINNNNPAASFFMYVGLEKENATKVFSGTEKYLLNPANYYVAAPQYGDWASVAMTDPNFPNVMAHLNTGFEFDGDGAAADASCPAAQLVGQRVGLHCTTILQEDKLNKLSAPAGSGATGVVTTWQFATKKTGYAGSSAIADLFDPAQNSEWSKQYSDIQDNQKYQYGSLLNPAIGTFRTKVTVGDFQLQEIQGLGKELGAPGTGLITGALGAEKKPYVASGIWIYQTQDTPLVKTVLTQLQNSNETAKIPLVWDYIVALDHEGAVIPLHDIQPGENNFQYFTFNPQKTKVRYLCSLLQDFTSTFQVYELDGNTWTTSDLAGISNPLADQHSDFVTLFSEKSFNDVRNQIAHVKEYVQNQVKYGPFTLGSKQLTISSDLLDAQIPIYKVPGSLEDGSDDYVVAVSWPPALLTLPTADTKYIWSLVTSRVYTPNFSPDGELWHVKVSGDGSDTTPYKVGFSNTAKSEFPYTAPLYSVIMPQDINPNIIFYNNEHTRLPAPDLYAAKILPLGKATVEKTLTAADAPSAAKELWKAINMSFESWKAFMEALGDTDSAAVSASIAAKTWVQDRFPPIELHATSVADIINGFYVYKTEEYPGEFLVMATNAKNDSSPALGKEFDTTNPQRYLVSLTTGNVYDAQQKGGLVAAAPLSVSALWNTVQKNSNWPASMQTWQTKLADLQKNIATLKGDALSQAQAEITMLQQYTKTQRQATFNKLDAALKKSQKIFDTTAGAQQYGNNNFGPFDFFINKIDLKARSYFYQDVTNIANPLSKLDSNGDVQGVTGYFVCGQTQPNGSVQWGYPLDGTVDRVLNLITGDVYARGGFMGAYAKFTENSGSQTEIDAYFNQVLAAMSILGVKPRPALTTKMTALLTDNYNLLEKEKQDLIALENKEKAENAPMDSNLQANLKSAAYLTNASSITQGNLKPYAGKYYLVTEDNATPPNILTYTDYNVGASGKDNNVGAVYGADGSMLVHVTDWTLENMRAKAGVVVAANGAQSLTIGVNQPFLPMQNMVKLATIPAGGTATAEDVVLKKQVDAAVGAVQAARAAVKKSPNSTTAQQQVLTASNDLALKKLMYRSANSLAIAIANNYITPAKGWTYEYYFNAEIGAYFGKIIHGDTQYYLDLASGLTYETTGMPRITKEPVFVESSKQLRAMSWFEGDTKHKLLFAVLPNSANGKQYNVYTTTYSVPSSDYVPAEGQAAVTYTDATGKQRQAIQMQVTNILNPDDDKMIVTNDFVRPQPSTIQWMNVWNSLTAADGGDQLTELGSTFNPVTNNYFAHAMYVQTRAPGQASGVFDPKNVNKADDIPTIMVWDGSGDMKLQQLYYQYQFIDLKDAGNNAYTGSYTSADGKSRSITVTKEQRPLTMGTGPHITAMWLSIQDGNKVLDYHYDTSVIEQDAMNTLKKLWGINVVTDAYGQSRLSVKIPTVLRAVTSVARVPSGQEDTVNAMLAHIKYDGAAKRYLYQVTTETAQSYGLETYEATMNNWYVDLLSGVLFDLDGYPAGKALSASDLLKIMSNLMIGVTVDSEGNAIGLHYRTNTDVQAVSPK